MTITRTLLTKARRRRGRARALTVSSSPSRARLLPFAATPPPPGADRVSTRGCALARAAAPAWRRPPPLSSHPIVRNRCGRLRRADELAAAGAVPDAVHAKSSSVMSFAYSLPSSPYLRATGVSWPSRLRAKAPSRSRRRAAPQLELVDRFPDVNTACSVQVQGVGYAARYNEVPQLECLTACSVIGCGDDRSPPGTRSHEALLIARCCSRCTGTAVLMTAPMQRIKRPDTPLSSSEGSSCWP